MQSDWNQPKVLQIEVLKAEAVAEPPDCSCPVRMVRAAMSMPFSSVAEIMKIIPISMMPNSSMKNGAAIRAISTAAVPRSARTTVPIIRRKRARVHGRRSDIGRA